MTTSRDLSPARSRSLALVVALPLVLAACGGDQDDAVVGGGPVAGADAGPGAGTTTDPSTATAPESAAAPDPADVGGDPLGFDDLLAPVIDPEAEIDADDQRGDGTSVVVEEVSVSAPTHVVVLDRDSVVRGVADVEAGRDIAVTVDLTDPLTESGRLAVMLFDDADGAAFDPAVDAPLVDDDDSDDADDVFDDVEIEQDDLDYRVG